MYVCGITFSCVFLFHCLLLYSKNVGIIIYLKGSVCWVILLGYYFYVGAGEHEWYLYIVHYYYLKNGLWHLKFIKCLMSINNVNVLLKCSTVITLIFYEMENRIDQWYSTSGLWACIPTKMDVTNSRELPDKG